jgi:hypothetical protein
VPTATSTSANFSFVVGSGKGELALHREGARMQYRSGINSAAYRCPLALPYASVRHAPHLQLEIQPQFIAPALCLNSAIAAVDPFAPYGECRRG